MRNILKIFFLSIIAGCYSTEVITVSSPDISNEGEECLNYPVAYISGDKEVIPGESVQLWLSLHPMVCKDNIVSFEWSQLSGPSIRLTNNGSDNTSFIATPEYGDIVLKVTIKGKSNSYTDTVKIKVVDKVQNIAPFADADGDLRMPVGYSYRATANYSIGTNRANMKYLWITVPEPDPLVDISSSESDETYISVLDTVSVPHIVLLEAIENELRSTRDIKLIYSNDQTGSLILPPRFEAEIPEQKATPGSPVELRIKNIDKYKNREIFWFQLSGERVKYNSNDKSLSFTAPNFASDLVFSAHVKIDGLFSPPVFFKVSVENSDGVFNPVADAGPDQKVKILSEVKLNGSKSYVSYPRKIYYKWKQVYGNTVNIKDSDTAFPTFTAPRMIGKIVIMLTVSDGYMDSRADSVVIDVSNN